jgi:2'-hydroxyisoflavone reductase
MKLLVIGGTKLVGPGVVEAALAAGHEVCTFNRGVSNPGRFGTQVEELHGDRDGRLQALEGRTWDSVVDTCGYVPRIVEQSARLLADATEQYVFVSTLSVYKDTSLLHSDESAPLADTEGFADTEEVTGDSYGPLKVLCERIVQDIYGERAFIPRPGLVVGPNDHTDRFVYWPWRVAQGGEVLAPQPPDYPVQVIDGRDLGAWIVRMAEQRGSGAFNAVGPEQPFTMQTLLETCREVSGSDATVTWVSAEFLAGHKVEPWGDIPLWMPGEEYAGFHSNDVSKAVAAGLTFRPLAETVTDTLAWASERPADHEWKAGLRAERESELLKAWHASNG